MKNPTRTADVAVIGGGAAGMMAAITAAESGAAVIVLERNGYCGKKLNLTGKGRCNITNNCAARDAISNIPHGGKALYSALNAFSPEDAIRWFCDRGLPLKTERGGRVFPESDKATDVSALLRSEMHRAGVRVVQGRARKLVINSDGIAGVEDENGLCTCKAVILATGGLSYPATGSTGDGYALASAAGHTITSPHASIVPLVSDDALCAGLAGLGLKNVSVSAVTGEGKTLYTDFGELLFTHFGVSGPTVLSMSAHLCDYSFGKCTLCIDLKPALDEAKLDARILRDFADAPNRTAANVLCGLTPKALAPVVLHKAGVEENTPVNSITREQRKAIVNTLKRFEVNITGLRPVDEAVVTSGGVSLREIDPRSMSSKLVKGLYFAGEVVDADAYTGGYNLQIAWSTGHLAGTSASKYVLST